MTTEAPAMPLQFDECGSCGARWRPRRDFCPRCGARDPVRRDSEGAGVIVAVTTVKRPPARDIVGEYSICLVDLAEGVRVMAHATPDAGVGVAVVATTTSFGDLTVPLFQPKEPERP